MAGQTAPQREDQLTYPKRNAQVEAELLIGRRDGPPDMGKKKSNDLNGADKRKSPAGGVGGGGRQVHSTQWVGVRVNARQRQPHP